MNNKGQTLFLSIVFAVFLFMCGMLIIDLIKPDITDARVNLDCTNMSISDGVKVSCLATDIAVPYLFILVVSVAGGLIFSRILI